MVDDDDNWCFISKIILQKAGIGKQIITANNGLKALAVLRQRVADGQQLPELIFLDIKMPVMNGFEFLDELVNAAELDLSHTQIYICSSSVNAKDKETAGLYPIAGFITKPLTQDILNQILK
nr:response regulator [Pontibacter liquoris]